MVLCKVLTSIDGFRKGDEVDVEGGRMITLVRLGYLQVVDGLYNDTVPSEVAMGKLSSLGWVDNYLAQNGKTVIKGLREDGFGKDDLAKLLGCEEEGKCREKVILELRKQIG